VFFSQKYYTWSHWRFKPGLSFKIDICIYVLSYAWHVPTSILDSVPQMVNISPPLYATRWFIALFTKAVLRHFDPISYFLIRLPQQWTKSYYYEYLTLHCRLRCTARTFRSSHIASLGALYGFFNSFAHHWLLILQILPTSVHCTEA
jgi:hypothetical protein